MDSGRTRRASLPVKWKHPAGNHEFCEISWQLCLHVSRVSARIEVNGQQTTDNSHFVYQSGEDLIIDAEGTVQIIDVMGRVLVSDEVESTNNRINVSGFRNGTYMVRVINGSEVKVEKVVIY